MLYPSRLIRTALERSIAAGEGGKARGIVAEEYLAVTPLRGRMRGYEESDLPNVLRLAQVQDDPVCLIHIVIPDSVDITVNKMPCVEVSEVSACAVDSNW